MASRFSDPSWWPSRPPQPAPSATRIVLGSVVPVIAFVGVAAAIWIGGSGHETRPATTVSPPARTVASDRESLAECVRSLGGSGGSRLGGRFRSGPSEKFREGVAVCRSLLRPGAAPAAPPRTTTAGAPVA